MAWFLWSLPFKIPQIPFSFCEYGEVTHALHYYYHSPFTARWYILCPLDLPVGWLDKILSRLTLLSKLKNLLYVCNLNNNWHSSMPWFRSLLAISYCPLSVCGIVLPHMWIILVIVTFLICVTFYICCAMTDLEKFLIFHLCIFQLSLCRV